HHQFAVEAVPRAPIAGPGMLGLCQIVRERRLEVIRETEPEVVILEEIVQLILEGELRECRLHGTQLVAAIDPGGPDIADLQPPEIAHDPSCVSIGSEEFERLYGPGIETVELEHVDRRLEPAIDLEHASTPRAIVILDLHMVLVGPTDTRLRIGKLS